MNIRRRYRNCILSIRASSSRSDSTFFLIIPSTNSCRHSGEFICAHLRDKKRKKLTLWHSLPWISIANHRIQFFRKMLLSNWQCQFRWPELMAFGFRRIHWLSHFSDVWSERSKIKIPPQTCNQFSVLTPAWICLIKNTSEHSVEHVFGCFTLIYYQFNVYANLRCGKLKVAVHRASILRFTGHVYVVRFQYQLKATSAVSSLCQLFKMTAEQWVQWIFLAGFAFHWVSEHHTIGQFQSKGTFLSRQTL